MDYSKMTKQISKFVSVSRKQGLHHALRKTQGYLEKGRRRESHSAESFEPYKPLAQHDKPYRHIRVASILDEFSELAWGQEFNLIPITPQNFLKVLSSDGDTPIDLLFVESAWSGSGGAWKGHLVGEGAPSREIEAVLECARRSGIPAVFWNKEDPAHFEDFIATARLFDYIFTTDEGTVDRYRREIPRSKVGILPFAAQPAFHNPVVEPGHQRTKDFVFAGTYFAKKFPIRQKQIQQILDAAGKASERLDSGLTIFSRFGNLDPKYRFPSRYRKYEKGFLPYSRMVTAYKHSKIVLNVNTVPESSTMCSRRVFEAAACGAVVVSTESNAIRNFFSDNQIPVLLKDEEGDRFLEALARSSELTDRIAHKAEREIWEKHTYTHRGRRILEAAGLLPVGDEDQLPEVAVISSTNRPEQLRHLLQQVVRQKDVKLEWHLMLHGIDVEAGALENALPSDIQLYVYRSTSSSTLGQNLNYLVDRTSAGYIAKMDDDDLYGERYLRDQINALRYSGADVVGKKASYVHLEDQDIFALRNPNHELCFTDFVAGPTLVWRRKVTERIRFPDRNRGEDSSFLYEATKRGLKIFSADRFNFVQVRSANRAHTWGVGAGELLANSEVISVGSGPLNVEV